MRSVILPGTLVAANTNSPAVAIPASGPYRAVDGAKFRADIEICARIADLTIALGIQTSNDLASWDNDDGTLIIGYQTSNGWHHSSAIADLSSLTNDAQWFRFVWYVKLTQAGNLATAFVHGSVDLVPWSG